MCCLGSNAQIIFRRTRSSYTVLWVHFVEFLPLYRASLTAQLETNCLQCKRPRLASWVRKIWRRDRLPTPVFLGFPCGSAGKESTCNEGDLGLIPGLGRSPGEGKGYPFQYSGLENSRDCTVHAVTKSRKQLSNFHFPLYNLSKTFQLPEDLLWVYWQERKLFHFFLLLSTFRNCNCFPGQAVRIENKISKFLHALETIIPVNKRIPLPAACRSHYCLHHHKISWWSRAGENGGGKKTKTTQDFLPASLPSNLLRSPFLTPQTRKTGFSWTSVYT